MAISFDDLKKLSTPAKTMIVVFVILLIGYLDWFYFLSEVVEKKTTLSNKLEELQGQIKDKDKIAQQLNKYKVEVAALQDNYKLALQKLPDQREIPGLLLSIAQAGKEAGIESVLFEPKAAVPKMMDKQMLKEGPKAADLLKPSDQRQADIKPAAGSTSPTTDGKKGASQEPFYEEIPIAVTILGSFQNVVYFFEKVSKLPRIINISDISMGDRKDIKGKGYVINTSCTIKTYMFVDKKEKTSDKTK